MWIKELNQLQLIYTQDELMNKFISDEEIQQDLFLFKNVLFGYMSADNQENYFAPNCWSNKQD